jgi:hypothetical protein
LSTQKVTVLRRFQSLVHTSWVFHPLQKQRMFVLLDVPKESLSRSDRGRTVDESYKMALTFGTLLSSQGADAHHHDSFEAIRGNPRYFTWSVPHGQTRPALPRLPLGRGDSRRVRCLVLGGTSARLHSALASRRGPLRDSVSRTRRTLVRGRAGCKFRVQAHAAQCFRGVHRRGIGGDREDRRV